MQEELCFSRQGQIRRPSTEAFSRERGRKQFRWQSDASRLPSRASLRLPRLRGLPEGLVAPENWTAGRDESVLEFLNSLS